MNSQDFVITLKDNKVKVESKGMCSGENKGIVMYHFELGAGKENFEWG